VKPVRTDALVVGGAGILAYSLLAYLSTATDLARSLPALGVVVALAPIVAVLAWMAWVSPRRVGALVLLLAGLALLAPVWPSLQRNFTWLYFLQHVGTNLFLAWFFGQSLIRERQPLCTRFALAVRGGRISTAEVVYSRQVTWVWTLFFVAIAGLSTLLFLFASIGTWSLFANFLTLPLMAGLFVIEYLVRIRLLPESRHTRLLDGVTAYWHSTRGDSRR